MGVEKDFNFDSMFQKMMEQLELGADDFEQKSQDTISDAITDGIDQGIVKAAKNLDKSVPKAAQNVGKAVAQQFTETISSTLATEFKRLGKNSSNSNAISKEFTKFLNNELTIERKKGKHKETIDIVSDFVGQPDISNFANELNQRKKEILTEVASYYDSISDIKNSYNKYQASGQMDDKSLIFDSVQVSKNYEDFIKKNNIVDKKLQRSIANREKLYSAFLIAQAEYENKSNSLGNFSDLTKNTQALKDGALMVKLAKEISHMTKDIGISDQRFDKINITALEQKVNKLGTNILQKGVEVNYTKEIDAITDQITNLINRVRQYMDEHDKLLKSFQELKKESTDTEKKVTKSTRNISDELKKSLRDPNRYIKDAKNISHGLSGKNREEGTYNIYKKFNEVDPDAKIDFSKNMDMYYQYVGEVTNLINSQKWHKEDNDKAGVLFYQRLIDMSPELKEFANIVKQLKLTGSAPLPTPSEDNLKALERESELRKQITKQLERSKDLGIDQSQLTGIDGDAAADELDGILSRITKINDERERARKIDVKPEVKVNETGNNKQKENNARTLEQVNIELEKQQKRLKQIEEQDKRNDIALENLAKKRENYSKEVFSDNKPVYDSDKLKNAGKSLNSFNTQLEKRNQFEEKYVSLCKIITDNYVGKYGIYNGLYDNLDDFISTNSSMKFLSNLMTNGIKGVPTKEIEKAFSNVVQELKSQGQAVASDPDNVHFEQVYAKLEQEEIELNATRQRLYDERQSQLAKINKLQQEQLNISRQTANVEENTKAHDRNNDSLAEKLQYLKDIQKHSKFMETAYDRKSSMEDKAYDVGGNNPKSEADSSNKINMYENLCESIEQADKALDEFEAEYDTVTITMKNGRQVFLHSLEDLENFKLLKSQISDISFTPYVEDDDVEFDKNPIFEAEKELLEEKKKTKDITDDVNKSTEKNIKLQDNLGREIDDNNAKLLQGTKILDKQGRIFTLYHNSDKVFDKFDLSAAGNNQGLMLGNGVYLSTKQSEFNHSSYGSMQTEWYAKSLNLWGTSCAKFTDQTHATAEQIESVINHFFADSSQWTKDYVTQAFTGGFKTADMLDKLDYSFEHEGMNYSGIDILKYLGFDGIDDGLQINIFDPENVIRANDIIKAIDGTVLSLEEAEEKSQSILDLRQRIFENLQKENTNPQSLEEYDSEIERLNQLNLLIKEYLKLKDMSPLDAFRGHDNNGKYRYVDLNRTQDLIDNYQKKKENLKSANHEENIDQMFSDEEVADLFEDEIEAALKAAQSSTETTETVVENNQKQEQSYENLADTVQQAADNIQQAEQKIQDSSSIPNPSNDKKDTSTDSEKKIPKSLQFNIEDLTEQELERKIKTAQAAIKDNKSTADAWKEKLPLMETALENLVKQRKEQEELAEAARKENVERNKQAAREAEYNDRVISQKGLVGDEEGWNVTKRLGEAQTQEIVYRYDKDTGDLNISEMPIITNFEQLSKLIMKTDEQIAKLEVRLESNKAAFGKAYDSSYLEKVIASTREYLDVLEREAKKYGDSDESTDYALNYKNFLEERTKNLQLIENNKQDKLAITKAKAENKHSKSIDSSNSFLSRQLNILKDIQFLYDKKVNPNALKALKDGADLNDLRAKQATIEQKIASLRGTNLSQDQKDSIISQVKDLDRARKSYTDKLYGATDLTPKELDVSKAILTNNFDAFIEKLKAAGDYTTDLRKEVETFKTSISSIGSSNGVKDASHQLKEYESRFKVLRTQEQTRQQESKSANAQIEEEYNKNYNAIKKYSDAQDELNKLIEKQVKHGKSEELTAKIVQQTKEVVKLRAEAEKATGSIIQMFGAGKISEDDKELAKNLYDNTRLGKTDSFETLAAIRRDKDKEFQYAGQTKAYEEYLSDMFKDSSIEDAMFKNASVDSTGKGVLTFLELVGDSARETKVYLDDVNEALDQMQKGEFDFNAHKTTSKWRNATAKDFDGNAYNKINDRVDAYEQLIKTEDKYQKLSAKVEMGKATPADIAEFNKLTEARKKYNDIISESIETLNEEERAVYNSKQEQFELLEQRYKKQQEDSQLTRTAYINAYKVNNSESDVKNAISTVSNKMNTLSQKTGIGYSDYFAKQKKEVDALTESLEKGVFSVEEYYKRVGKITSDLDNTIAFIEPNAIDNGRAALESIIKSMDGAEFTGFKDLGNGIYEATGKLHKHKGAVEDISIVYSSFNGKVSQTKSVLKDVDTSVGVFFTKLKKRFGSLVQYLMTFGSFYEIVGIIRQGINVVKDLDSSLTEMRKVSDESVSSLKRFQDVSFDVAHNIGSTAKQIQNSAADFMRLGYSLDTASKLAEDANIYANVGDMDISEATEHMVSSIQAWKSEFDNEVEASSAIVDRYNEIGNNFAITSADIGSAMERSAAALKAGGNTLNESIALITAGNLIQQDADTTANALKVMSLRIRGSKAELAEMGEETDNLASSSSKLREQIKALTGVDIMLDEDTYKSTAAIIQEIGEQWEKLSDVSQAATLETLAGKTRASTVAGLLENYETIGEVIESAENADGSAIEENARYVESIAGKIAQFQNEAQEFWHTVLDTDVIKDAIDFGTSLLDIAGKLIGFLEDIHALIPSILGIGGTVALNTDLGKSFTDIFKNVGRDKMHSLIYSYIYKYILFYDYIYLYM